MTAVTSSVPTARTAPQNFAPIPFVRIVKVELRKMFDTRSGFWLMASIVILSTLATIAVIVFGNDSNIKYSSFATAIGVPMAILLPVIAILSVTSEWSQRSGLTTFTLVPHRNRIILAKGAAAIIVGVTSMVLAMAIGALGNLVGAAIKGTSLKWDSSIRDLLLVIMGNVLGLLVGFMLGLLIRNSAGAIVGYFVYKFVLPIIFGVLAGTTTWFDKVQKWVDFNYNLSNLFDGKLTGQDWGALGVTSVLWLVLPLTLGIWLVLRSEVK